MRLRLICAGSDGKEIIEEYEVPDGIGVPRIGVPRIGVPRRARTRVTEVTWYFGEQRPLSVTVYAR